jgi:hypothetical protein
MEELLAKVEVVPMASHRQPRRRVERVHDDGLNMMQGGKVSKEKKLKTTK